MKATLQFTLPEEHAEFMEAASASSLRCALCDMAQYLRDRLKHEDLTGNVHEAVQHARDTLWGIMGDNDVAHIVDR